MGEKDKEEFMKIPHRVSLVYRYAAGPYMSRFCEELKENKRFVANKCKECGRHLFPPRMFCPDCGIRASDEWVEVGPEGTVLFATEVGRASIDLRTGERMKMPTPYSALIQIDGVAPGRGAFFHWLKVNDPDQAREGLRIKPVFKEERFLGTLEDVICFEPVDEE